MAGKTIDYYFSVGSPWAYLGSARFSDMVRRHGARVNVMPVDYTRIFAASGGTLYENRAPQRRNYRQVELARWRRRLGIPLTLEPRFSPVDRRPASYLLIVARRRQLPASSYPMRSCALSGTRTGTSPTGTRSGSWPTTLVSMGRRSRRRRPAIRRWPPSTKRTRTARLRVGYSGLRPILSVTSCSGAGPAQLRRGKAHVVGHGLGTFHVFEARLPRPESRGRKPRPREIVAAASMTSSLRCPSWSCITGSDS